MKKIILSGLLCTALFADFTLEYQVDGHAKQLVQYKDAKHIKITTDTEKKGESTAQLIVGEKKFMVMKRAGKTEYMDMDVMKEKMKQMASMFGGGDINKPKEKPALKYKILKKSKGKKIDGIETEKWTISVTEEGKTEKMDLLVSKDEKVVDAVGKYVSAMEEFNKMSPEEESGLSEIINIKPGYVTVSFEGMKLKKYNDADIPDKVFALPAGMDVGKKLKGVQTTTVKKPPLCPLVGKHGDAKQLKKMLKTEVDGWKLIENGTCINMMKMRAENAIYQKGDAYIHINLSINVAGENGMIAKYRTNNMKVSNLQQGKIQGHRYQSALLNRVGQNAMDIKLSNAMLSLTATKNVKDELPLFAKSVFDLSQFVPIKKSKPTADDALKSLGGLLGGKGGGQADNAQNNADMQKAGEMLKGLFGN